MSGRDQGKGQSQSGIGSCCESKQARVSQRVSGHSLHDGTSYSKCRSHKDCRDLSRQANFANKSNFIP
ncbi:Uncharacterised protein [Mycobacterium tuberculosis]|nr:Uncharacterised protein [Mycobacterium tuberculosis]